MFDIAIIGCGPVGAFAANLLGRHGLSVVVIERGDAPCPHHRAVHIDHEVMRLLQSVGLAESARPMMRAAQGHLHIGADGQILRYLGTAGRVPRFGWPADLFFCQPELEALLREGMTRFPKIDLRRNACVTGLEQSDGSVRLTVDAAGASDQVEARYAIACDGAASPTRRLLDIALLDLDFDEQWLVIDLDIDAPIQFPRYDLPPEADIQQLSVMLCDPARPATIVPGRGRHRRWEFMLLPGEQEEAVREPAFVAELLAPWVGDAPYRLVRAATYRFHGLLAERWQEGCIFLAGDAAHQTPPFFGQGLCHGIRDVANLAWKLALVIEGSAPPALLDSYQDERAPQVRAVVAAAIDAGRYICELDPTAAAARDKTIRAREAATGPRTAADLIAPIGGLIRAGDAAAGTRFVQPFVVAAGRRKRLDDATGGGARLLTRSGAAVAASIAAPFARIGGTLHQVGSEELDDQEGGLTAWFGEHGVDAVLVRPDFYVFGTAAAGGEAALVGDWIERVGIPQPSLALAAGG